MTGPTDQLLEYVTAGGVEVRRQVETVDATNAIESLVDSLDAHRGALFTSNYEFPGRYNRWSSGFVNPPLALEGWGREFRISALNDRGNVLVSMVQTVLEHSEDVAITARQPSFVRGTVAQPAARFAEEDRSKQPSIFTVIRALRNLFASDHDHTCGLRGAFGYDLAFQFEDVTRHQERDPSHRDLVLYLADTVVEVDHAAGIALRYQYDFSQNGKSTVGLDRSGPSQPYAPAGDSPESRDHQPGEFAATVAEARKAFACGDLFEVVPSQAFRKACPDPPSTVFRRIRKQNPAPFSGLLNLGEGEYLVSGSPEMYLRSDGERIETCPIAGTVARGADALGDSQAMVELLTSEKAAAELTMCTDVDRNDKARVCEPGSIEVIGRRQVEFYSRVIHTVDHIVGRLRSGFDAFDAFLSHMWAVTVTGAPKLWAMRFIEQHEHSPRRWYAGAIGYVGFDGSLNTGITIRTVHITDGVASVRAGGTVLIDSDPAEEERESEMKASAFLAAITSPTAVSEVEQPAPEERNDKHVLLLDHEDSFVHTLALYFRQAGARVTTVRAPLSEADFAALVKDKQPDLICLSPGPGEPTDFRVSDSITFARNHDLPIFGVCLGLQAIVEHFGGTLGTLEYPMHGKQSYIQNRGGSLLAGLPPQFKAGRYHSLYAQSDAVPDDLDVTASTDDGVVMAVEHKSLPITAVQFHPESILSADDEAGLRLVRNVLNRYGTSMSAR